MVQEKLAESLAPLPSAAVTVTDEVPAVVGVPLMAPVALSMESPAGRPVADHVRVATGEESVAEAATAVTAEPDTEAWSSGPVTVTTLVMVQEKLAESLAPLPSVAVTVTDEVPAVVGVPLMAPVALSMESPAGRPVADHVRVATGEESVAEAATGVTAEPDTEA